MKSKQEIWSHIKSYRFNSIFIRNFILVTLLVVMPIVGIGMALYGYFDKTLQSEIENSNINILSRVRDMLGVIFEETEKVSYSIAMSPETDSFLANSFSNSDIYNDADKQKKIIYNMNATKSISKYIHSVYLYSEVNHYVITSDSYAGDLDKFQDNSWYDQYEREKKNNHYWIYPRTVSDLTKDHDDYQFISIFCMVPVYGTNTKGVVIINIDKSQLEQLMNNLSNQWFENIYIVNKDQIIYSMAGKPLNKDVKDILEKQETSPPNKYSIIKNVNGINKVISIINFDKYSWKLVSVVPLNSYQEKTERVRKFIVSSIIIGIMIAIIFAFWISIHIYQPIKSIVSILKTAGGNVNIENVTKKSETNELYFILNNIANTFMQQRQLENELSNRLTLLRNAQTVALQSQINPHFIYNTLDAINWKVIYKIKEDNEISAMIEALANLLRLSVESQDHLISIGQEMEHVKCYILIQKIRYEDKFDVVWEVSPDILAFRIVKITLQPLIENAIYHGIKPKQGPGTIRISGALQEERINIAIEDNGVGMNEDQLNKLRTELKDNDNIYGGAHIGVKNVNQRIKLIFGDKYGLQVHSQENKGTTIYISIPNI